MSRTRETTTGHGSTMQGTKTYRVSLQVEQVIYADDEEEALSIFWDDLMRSQVEEENATVEKL